MVTFVTVWFDFERETQEILVTQIKVCGPGLAKGETGQRCLLHFSGAPIGELEKGLTTKVDGPQKSELMFDFERETQEGGVEAYYVPILPGDYKITIRFNGRQVTGSKITGEPLSGEKLISKICMN